jgi:hypothetical protein
MNLVSIVNPPSILTDDTDPAPGFTMHFRLEESKGKTREKVKIKLLNSNYPSRMAWKENEIGDHVMTARLHAVDGLDSMT